MSQSGALSRGTPQVKNPPEIEMAAYDNLPKCFRDHLKDLPLEISAKSIGDQLYYVSASQYRDVMSLISYKAREYYNNLMNESFGEWPFK